MSLLLATEGGIPGGSGLAIVAVPIAVVVFMGGIYLLVWAIYGAKKGALIYGTALFGFAAVLGVFWWFGAPGTPSSTALVNFPGQANDRYAAQWFAFEPDSDRAAQFESVSDPGSFVTVEEYLGVADKSAEDLASDAKLGFFRGDVSEAAGLMLDLYLPTDEFGSQTLGAARRTSLAAEAGPPGEGESRDDPFFTAELVDVLVRDDAGHTVAMGTFQTLANFASVDADGVPQVRQVEVGEPATYFAFRDDGALWYPSAVWTIASFLLFGLCLFGLDRVEQSEKRRAAEEGESADKKVPAGASA